MNQHRRRRRVALAGAMAVLSAACSRAAAPHAAPATSDPPMGVILGPEDLERWVSEGRAAYAPTRPNCDASCTLEQMRIPANVEFWRPPPSQVLPFEHRVYRELRGAWRQGGLGDPAGRYSVGYIGFVQEGKRLIYARGECGERDLRQGWTLVLDGGVCYFSAVFDPETGTFGIRFHGVA